MWYRIELNRDNSVSTCVEVEGSRTGDGKGVHFIEASSRQEAISILLSRYEKNLAQEKIRGAKYRTERKDNGQCVTCKSKDLHTATYCKKCNDRKLERQRELRKGGARLRERPESKIDRAVARAKRRSQVADVRASNSIRSERRALVKCLEAFDSMTTNAYRTWLVEQLKIAQDKELASAEKRRKAYEQKSGQINAKLAAK